MELPKHDLAMTAEALNSGAIQLLRAMRVVDRDSGLTPQRLSVLSVLVDAGPLTLGRLAQAEDVSSPTMTRIVDGLVNLGLVCREPHPDSARLVRVSATEHGREVMEAARARRIEVLVAGVRSLGLREQRRLTSAAPVLAQLAGAIRTHQAEMRPDGRA